MRITYIGLKNVRQHRSTEITLPPGLTLLMGENDTGKTTLSTVGVRWCLWGATPGRVQDDLLRHGERKSGRTNEAVSSREMTATVEFNLDTMDYIVSRRFVLSPSGQGGTTSLTLTSYCPTTTVSKDLTGAVNADTQQKIIDLIGTDAMFVATVMTTQREGPGQFLNMLPAQRRAVLRDVVAVDDRWSAMSEQAKLKRQNINDTSRELALRLLSAEEEAGKKKKLETDLLEALEKEQELEKQISEENDAVEGLVHSVFLAGQRNSAIDAVAAIEGRIQTTEEAIKACRRNKEKYQELLNRENEILEVAVRHKIDQNIFDAATKQYKVDWDLFSNKYAAFEQNRKRYDEDAAQARDKFALLAKLADEYQDLRDNKLPGLMAENGVAILERDMAALEALALPCSTCGQPLQTDDAKERLAAHRALIRDEIKSKQERMEEIGHDIEDRVKLADEHNRGLTAVEPSHRPPVAPIAPTMSYDVELQKQNAVEIKLLDEAKQNWSQMTEMEHQHTTSLDQAKLKLADAIVSVEDQASGLGSMNTLEQDLSNARKNRANTEKKMYEGLTHRGWLEGAIESARKAELDVATYIEDLKAIHEQIDALSVVERMTSSAGIPQLMIDEALIQLQIASNDWLKRLLPGYSVYFSTQSETGRETLTEGIRIPAGDIVSFADLGGAAATGVALAVREGLAEIAQSAHGISHECRFYDEADAALVGEKQEAYLQMLMTIAETGKTVVAISHIAELQDRIDNRIVLESTASGTVVKKGK